MDDDFEPLLLEGDLPSLPDIHADDLLVLDSGWDLLTCESVRNGRKGYEFSDQVSVAISSPQHPPSRKMTEKWLIDQVGPIIEANACSPRKLLLFPKTFNGLIAKHALTAHMSEQNLSVTLTSKPNEGTTDTTDSHAQGAEKKSKKNQSRRGMTYKCEQCGEKKKKCKCGQVIDASVVTLINNDTTPSESFERKPEFCIYVSERGVTSRSPPLVTSKSWIDREIAEEKAELSKESSVEVPPRERGGRDQEIGIEIDEELDQESLWTDSIVVVKY